MSSRSLLWTSLLAAVAAALLALVVMGGLGRLVGSAAAQEQPDPPAAVGEPTIIGNENVRLGVNPEGNLGAPGGPPSPSAGTNVVGLRFAPTGNEAISPGTTQESWGVADASSGTYGHADENDFYFIGKNNATATEFSATEETVRSVVAVAPNGTAPAPGFEVTHEFRPSPFSPNLYEALVTVENNSANPAQDVRYRRVVDWDIEPTEFSEYVTIGGKSPLPELLFSSNDGFADPNPLGGRTDDGATGFFTDSGPYDQGATFDFGLGALGPGEQRTFKLFYGAAANEADSLKALNEVGADTYTLGQPDTQGGPDLGTPNGPTP